MSVEGINEGDLYQNYELAFFNESDESKGERVCEENRLSDHVFSGPTLFPSQLQYMAPQKQANEALTLITLKKAVDTEDIDLFKTSFSLTLPAEKVADIYKEAIERCSESFLEKLESFFDSKQGIRFHSYKYSGLQAPSSHERHVPETSYLESLLLSPNFSDTDRLIALLKSHKLHHSFCDLLFCLCFSSETDVSYYSKEGNHEKSVDPFISRLSLAQTLIDNGVNPLKTAALEVAISSYNKVGCEFLINQPEFDRESFRISLYKQINIFKKIESLFNEIFEKESTDRDNLLERIAFLESLSIKPFDEEEMLDQLYKHISTPQSLLEEDEIILYSLLPFIESPLYGKLEPKSRSSLLVNFLLNYSRRDLEDGYDCFIKQFETHLLPSFLRSDFDLEFFLNQIMAGAFKNPSDLDKDAYSRKTNKQIVELHKQLESSSQHKKKNHEYDKETSLETILGLLFRNKIIHSLIQNEKFHSALVELDQGKEFLEKLDVFNKDCLQKLPLFLHEDLETISDEKALVATRLYTKYFEE